MIDRPSTRRVLLVLFAVGFAIRLLIAALTPIPAEDGANYLWMAERFAEGRADLALGEVFPPLLPLMTAPLVWLGFDPFRAGQLVSALCGALALIAIVRLTEVLLPRGGFLAGWLCVTAPLPVRFAGEVYTEPAFHLFGACALYLGLRRRFWLCGLLAGVAFWLRPEAALIPLAFCALAPKRAWTALLPLAALVLALALWREATGNGFDLLPKLAFNLARPPVGEVVSGGALALADRFFENLVRIPWLSIEAFGPLGILALIGLAADRRRDFAPLWVLLGLAVVVICLFLPRRRFLVSWVFAIAPLAVAGLWKLPEKARPPVFVLVMIASLLLSLHVPPDDRYGERVVGEFLREKIEPGTGAGQVTGDMTRVLYFAGERPLPPRHFTADELVEMASAPPVRFVVLGSKRETAAPVIARLGESFEPCPMPYETERWARQRGLAVLRRK